MIRLADAFATLGEGTLTFVGEGPLRPRLEGRPGVMLAGAVPHDEVARRLAAADVLCQPSLIEPLGQALLEAMACGRPVVATRIGGPPEFVPPEAGVLVDPLDVDGLARALREAASLPVPSPWIRATGQQAYADQCTARQPPQPIRDRRTLVIVSARSRSKATAPRPSHSGR